MKQYLRQSLKAIIKKTSFYHPLRNRIIKQRQAKKLKLWKKQGCPLPSPHIVKQSVLKEYAKKYKIRILVETGTYLGDMIEAMKDSFDSIFSIELDRYLFESAKKRFANAKHVEIIHGDSSVEIAKLIENIQQPALFWLDAHYSAGITTRGDKDTPIYDELSHILSAQNFGHVILIDDARLFGTDPGYPTIDELKKVINSINDRVDIAIQLDIIRITPK